VYVELVVCMQFSVYCDWSTVTVPSPTVVRDTDKIFDILRRLRSLWDKVKMAPSDSLEYHSLLEEIRALSDEHHALIEAAQSPDYWS